eukprot:s821_g27.t4
MFVSDTFPNVSCFNAAISSCEKGREWQQALRIFSSIRTTSLQPDMISYSAAMSSCEKAGEWQHALCLFKDMCFAKVPVDVISFNAAISSCEKAGQWQQTLYLLQAMPTMAVLPNSISFNAVMSACDRGLPSQRRNGQAVAKVVPRKESTVKTPRGDLARSKVDKKGAHLDATTLAARTGGGSQACSTSEGFTPSVASGQLSRNASSTAGSCILQGTSTAGGATAVSVYGAYTAPASPLRRERGLRLEFGATGSPWNLEGLNPALTQSSCSHNALRAATPQRTVTPVLPTRSFAPLPLYAQQVPQAFLSPRGVSSARTAPVPRPVLQEGLQTVPCQAASILRLSPRQACFGHLGLQLHFESLETEPRKHLLQILQEMSTMNPEFLAETHNYMMCRKSARLPAQQKSGLTNVLAISGGSADVVEACVADEDSIFDQEATYIWDKARYVFNPACCDLAQNVDWGQFWEKIRAFAKLMHTGGIYFLYYSGHGMEIEASFHFIPKGAQHESDCISIGEVMAHFDKMAPVGCQVIFCINACRETHESSIRNPFDNEYGRSNKYYTLFSTSSGEEVPLQELDQQNIFQEAVATFMPQFTCDNVVHILDQIKESIQEKDQQQNPFYFCGGLLDPSSRASSGSSFSFATPAKWTDLLQGYTLMKGSPSSFRESQSSKKWQIKDTREDQRRRLNRFTAPTFDPDGCYYLFVKEDLMAWEYNLAYWGGSCGVIEGEGNMKGKGQINELKTYAISIALEGSGQRDYTESQYETLIDLMKDLRERWQFRAWNVLSAAEVVQPPQKEEDAEPGPKFDWRRLTELGLSLDVEEESLQPSDTFEEKELQNKMRDWGYAFGMDTDEHFRRRLSAFRQRYLQHIDLGGATFSGYDTAAVESLLQQRQKLMDLP